MVKHALVGPRQVLQANPVFQALLRLVARVGADDLSGLAAEMAYRFLFAVFPFFIFLAAVIGFVSAQVGFENLFPAVMGFLSLLFPREIQTVLADWVAGVLSTHSSGLLTFGAAGALWGAAGAIGTLMKGLNRAYEVADDRPFWEKQTIALVTTLGIAVLMISGVGVYTAGQSLGENLATAFGLGPGFLFVWDAIRLPAVNLALFVALAVVYRVLPNAPVSWRGAFAGAVFATLGWIAMTAGFSVYVSHFGSYDKTFGSLGAAVVLMFWMYTVSMILLIGGEINAQINSGPAKDGATSTRR